MKYNRYFYILVIAGYVTLHLAHDSFADSVESRASGDYTTESAIIEMSGSARQVIDRVDAQLRNTGRMPAYSEFLEMLTEAEVLSTVDRLNLFIAFGRIQKPTLSASELYDFLRAQQASLAVLHVIYNVRHLIPAPVNGQRTSGQIIDSCEFALQHPKVMFAKSRTIDGEFQNRKIEAYDGHIIRGKLSRPGSMEFASIQQLDTRSRFFEDTNPLLAAMLLNCEEHEPQLMFKSAHDAALLLKDSFVYESQETVAGYPCMIIGNPNLQAFIAPELGYAVVETRIGGLDVTPKGGYAKNPYYTVVTNSDFHKVSDGLWLPNRSEQLSVRHGDVYSHSVTSVKSYDCSPKNLEDLFTGEIPDGAYVAGVANNVSYLAGSDDIEKQLSKSVNNQLISSHRRWWLLFANGFGLAIMALVLVYRNWIKRP